MDPADHIAVCDTVYGYAEAMDTRDWESYRSLFGEDLDIDYSSFHPDQIAVYRADDWVANVRGRLCRLDATQHSMTNPRVRVRGDTAECRIQAQVQHVHTLGGTQATCLFGGRYRFALARRGEGWRIAGVRLTAGWTTGDTRVLDVARAD